MVHVIGDYYFDADSNCYTAYEKSENVDKEGNPIYKTLGYYSSSKDAVRGIAKVLHKQIASKENLEIGQFIKECEDINIQLEMTLNDKFETVDF